MNRFAACFIAAILFAGVCWVFPLFHIVPLERAAKEKAAAAFNPAERAERFWNEQLLKSLDRAVKMEVLLPLIKADRAEAEKKFSRSVGVSENRTYFLSGAGRVVAVNDEEISLALAGGSTNAEISLQIGLIFGNAVRDATGLLNVNDYPNSQDFNAVSEALNRIIEERVQPRLRAGGKIGATIHFVGCAELNDESTDLTPLKVVPVHVEFE